MALARIKTWNPGDVLTAADLNSEYNNVLNNPISLVSPTTGTINFNLQAHTNLPLTAVSASSGVSGALVAVSGTSLIMTTSAVSASGALVGSWVKGLTGNVGVTSSQTASLSFDQCLLISTSQTNSFLMTATGSFTMNAGTAGPAAGGRDQAGVFTSTFVHAFAISTGSSSATPAGTLSTNLVPTLPTSYNAYAYLGTFVYSSATTSFSQIQYVSANQVTVGPTTVRGSAAGTGAEQSYSLSTTVPRNHSGVIVQLYAGAGNSTGDLRAEAGGAPVGTTNTGFAGVASLYTVMPLTSQTLYFIGVGGVNYAIELSGYLVPNMG